MATRSFPPDVFARLAPDVFFARHLENGERPTGRRFLEKRSIEVRSGNEFVPGSLGCAIVKAGGATVICGITGGLTRFRGKGGIYANVEIHRGGMTGNPSGEEQVMSMSLHRLLQASNFDRSSFEINEEFELCLNAQIIVLSRTGPMLDLCWECLVAALQSARIPEFVEAEFTMDLVPSEPCQPLKLPSTLPDVHCSYGLTAEAVLADIDGAVEEECVIDRITAAKSSKTGLYSNISLSAPNGCNLGQLRDILNDVDGKN